MHGPARPDRRHARSAALIVKELLVGLAFAFSSRVLFAAVSAAGSLLDTLIGFSFGALVDPITGNQSPGPLAALRARRRGGLHRDRRRRLGHPGPRAHLRARPARRRPAHRLAGRRRRSTRSPAIFASALEVAAPVMIAVIITDAAFGVVSRVVPQLNVFAVGFPAKVDRRPARRRRLAAVRRRLDLRRAAAVASPPRCTSLKVA